MRYDLFTLISALCLLIVASKKLCFHCDVNAQRQLYWIFDYAFQTKKMLKHEAILLFPNASRGNHFIRYQKGVAVITYDGNGPNKVAGSNLPKYALDYGCDALFMIKDGTKSSTPAYPDSFDDKLPTFVHSFYPIEPHGTVYTSLYRNKKKVVHIPLIAHSRGNNYTFVAKILQLQPNSSVICSMGNQLDSQFIRELMQKHPIQYIEIASKSFTLFNKSGEWEFRTSLLSRYHDVHICDALVSGGKADTPHHVYHEFLVRSKPVFVPNSILRNSPSLQSQGVKGFSGPTDILNNIGQKQSETYSNAISVMKLFKKVYLDSTFGKNSKKGKKS